MPFERPTLSALIEQGAADFEGRLPGTDGRLRRSNINVFSRVIAGLLHGLYGYLSWIADQILPDTCDEDVLLRHASIWLEKPRKEASYAVGSASITGTTGRVLEAGTLLQRADGVTYFATADATIAGGAGTVALMAVEPGAAGNASAGTGLSLVSPVAGINAKASVSGDGIVGGSDDETIAALRDRVLARIRRAPHGGAQHDYVTWAREVPGVTRAWCYPHEMGVGSITVRVMRDGDADPFPAPAALDIVRDYIDTKRPVTRKQIYVVAPVAEPIDFIFSSLTPNTAAVRAAVAAELCDLIAREAEPGGSILLSHLRAAISAAAGESNYVLASPAADVMFATGRMATLGQIAWPT